MKIPTDPKDIKSIRDFFTNMRTQVCGMADFLSEPWKTHFNGVKDHVDEALKSLPPSDQVPAAMDMNHHLSCLYSCMAGASALCSMLGAHVDTMLRKNSETVASALNSAVEAKLLERIKSGEILAKTDLDRIVTETIGTRTTAGELVPKDTVTQLCSAAKDMGIKEGEKKVREELAAETTRKTTIAERKRALQTAGLPVPEEKLEHLLGGSEDEFKTLQQTAQERITSLQKRNIALNSTSPLLAKVFLPKDQWEVFENLTLEVLKGGDPLLTPPAPAGDVPRVMVC